MRRLDPIIDGFLQQASLRWRWLRFLRGSATLATVTTSIVLLLGITMLLDWLTSPTWVTASFVVLVLGALFAWFCIAVASAVSNDDPSHLAASLEHVDRPLMDRLNTLIFLRSRRDRQNGPYVERIQQQARQVLRRRGAPQPFSPRESLRHFGVFMAALLATILFYSCFQPFGHVVTASDDDTVVTPEEEYTPPVIPPIQQPGQVPPEQEPPWGEVRISEPGHDLRVITLDVVPLRIEAAANRPLQEVAWFTGINREPDVRHDLPPSDDPQYAVYTPELDLLDYSLEPWDVLSYFAQAITEDGQSYRSDVYFIEVLPLRDELDRLDEGTDNSGYGLLEQLTAMIERQQDVIRQTIRQQRLTDQSETDRKSQNENLAQDEDELSEVAQHVAAEVASRFGGTALDELNEPLGRAETALGQAAESLREDELNEAGQHEQVALAELVATRKQFHEILERALDNPASPMDDLDPLVQALEEQIEQYRQIEEQPDDFSPEQVSETTEKTKELLKKLDEAADEQPPEPPSRLRKELTENEKQRLTSQCGKLCQSGAGGDKSQAAGELKKGLRKLSDALSADRAQQQAARDNARLAEEKRRLERLQREIESARDFVKKTLLEERNLEKQANPSKKDQLPQLANKQRELNRSLDDFIEQHPESFCRSGKECSGAQSAMQDAAQAMADRSGDARQRAGQAAERLQELDESLEQHLQQNELAQAYKLKEMLDQQIEQLGECQNSGASPGQCQQLAGQAKSTTGQLKQIAEQPPTSEAFGPELREALSDENQGKLDSLADQLAQAEGSGGEKDAAGGLQEALQEVSRAFDASRPGGMQGQLQAGGGLRPGGSNAISRGMQLLEGAAQRQARGRPLSRQDQARLGREAASNLEAGMSEPSGYNERSRQVVEEFRRDLEEQAIPIDLELIRELREDIQQLRREVTMKDQGPDGEPEIKHIDPSRLPPAYRKSIETYFQKLSEER